MKNKKLLYFLAAAVFVIIILLAVMYAIPNGDENSKEASDLFEASEISEISLETSEESTDDVSFDDISETVSEEISEEESGLPEESFVPSVSDEVSENSEDTSIPPKEETSTPQEVSEEIEPTITVPDITVPEVTDTVWDGNAANSFEDGSGTLNDPFVIATPSQLAFFRDTVNSGNNYEGKYIRFSQSIRISNIKNGQSPEEDTVYWEGIGTEDFPFLGTFDGNGNAVFGLYGDGLFGVIEGNVKDVIIADSYITSGGAVASFAMKNYDLPEYTPFISGCAVVNSKICGIGGIVGYAGGYNIERCVNASTVDGNGDWVGGIVGEVTRGKMTDCYNTGSVYGTNLCGGIAGNASNNSFERCYNVGVVEGKTFSGGFAAVNIKSKFDSCGFLNSVSEYVFTEADGTYIKEVKGIIVFTQDEVG
ncbi:MAG: hypothetical protein J6Q24_00790 [Clostridia bacterium]|nr:hypothetical protein [Clostridia bacterium]